MSDRVKEAEARGVTFAAHLSDVEKDEIAVWFLKQIADEDWVAKIKSRSDEADLLISKAQNRRSGDEE